MTQTAEFKLTAPEAIIEVPKTSAKTMVELPPEKILAVETQVNAFVEKLTTENVDSDAFKSRLDSAFNLGREEISNVATLLTGGFMDQNSVGVENSKAYAAIADMRGKLDELNPGHYGDLLSQNKILGIIPYGNKLKAYFRKFESAGTQLQKSLAQINAAKDDMQKDEVKIESTRGKLWDGMQKLKGAIFFAETLDEKVSNLVISEMARDPIRGKALEQEVLFYARQNLQDMHTQMAVSVNGYLALDVLKKTAREMQNGCSRIATTGMSALAVAQTVARATGNQIAVMDMIQSTASTIESMVVDTSKQLGVHVQKTAQFAANPLIGVEAMKTAFNNTFEAMDAMDAFRSQAIKNMGQTNLLFKEQVKRSDEYIGRAKAIVNVQSAEKISGPVNI